MNKEDEIVAYVDGSFNPELQKYAYGCIIIKNEEVLERKSGAGNSPEGLAQRNVTGEMIAAMTAVQWCIKNGYSKLNICYDYSGIEMWATNGWRAKNDLTKKYKEYMQENMKRIEVSFTKIEAHTGNKYNEEVDKLAKAALRE